MKKEIEELLNSDLTSYKIAKETRITVQQIDRYRKNNKVGNITLDNALKLYNYKKEISKEKRKMLKLSFIYKGNVKEVFGNSIENAVSEALEYFKNDELANEKFNQGPEEFIKDFLHGDIRYSGEEYEYFKDIYNVCDLTFLQTEEFINKLDPELKQYIKKDEFNDEYYVEYNRGAYQIAEHLEQLAEELYF